MLSADSAPPSVISDPRHIAMETYWREVQSIEEEEEEEEERKSLDELELEEAWLVQSGLSHSEDLKDAGCSGPVEALLSTLTRRQTDTVRRRLDNYTQTLRQRNRAIRDVRHIFTQVTANQRQDIQVTIWFSLDSGLSTVEDFSEPDLRNIGFISHIELHTFLQSLGLSLTQNSCLSDSGVFGVSLKTLLESDRRKCPGTRTPLVFNKLLSVLELTGLQTEGILRISGSASRLKSLRRDLDRCSSDFEWSGLRPVDAAGLLKLFIRELPSPLLLTHPHTLRAIMGLESELHQVQSLQLLSLSLPESHRNTLQALLVFLARVAANQEQNRMSLWNVSMVMAPNLLPDNRRQEVTRAAAQEMEEAVGGAKLVCLLIRHRSLMWTVPCFLLTQVRQMNQASNQRSRRRLRRHAPQEHAVPSLCDDVIRVRAPLQLKVSTAMKLDATTTARDVTERFPHDAHRCQQGRRLHPDCFLLDVYRLNPGCDWLIKP
uniref:Rho-GAP domain-containing protein n=1 Tax=Periophthalmus magnuspinnatus TaxID=409849 RepID=A0A3B4BHP6_9GOBI